MAKITALKNNTTNLNTTTVSVVVDDHIGPLSGLFVSVISLITFSIFGQRR